MEDKQETRKNPRGYLITLRNKRRLSPDTAAHALLVSKKYLAMIEAGLWELKLSTLKGLAQLYGVTVDSLIMAEAQYKQCLLCGRKNDQV